MQTQPPHNHTQDPPGQPAAQIPPPAQVHVTAPAPPPEVKVGVPTWLATVLLSALLTSTLALVGWFGMQIMDSIRSISDNQVQIRDDLNDVKLNVGGIKSDINDIGGDRWLGQDESVMFSQIESAIRTITRHLDIPEPVMKSPREIQRERIAVDGERDG